MKGVTFSALNVLKGLIFFVGLPTGLLWMNAQGLLSRPVVYALLAGALLFCLVSIGIFRLRERSSSNRSNEHPQ